MDTDRKNCCGARYFEQQADFMEQKNLLEEVSGFLFYASRWLCDRTFFVVGRETGPPHPLLPEVSL